LAAKDLRINEQIRVSEVRLIDENGEQMGVVSLREALSRADELGLDLVEIAPQAEPPVCRILNYGKYKFEQGKKEREARRNQKQAVLKEVRMKPNLGIHDLDFKTKHVKEFLEDGNKVKITVRFRGREMAHTQLGADVLKEVLNRLGEDNYVLERAPLMEGRDMSMSLSPKNKK
jgi:translation initiation factor IF-3